MTDYEKQIEDFLKSCDARIRMKLVGSLSNQDLGDNRPRNLYDVGIYTPKGKMHISYWDSIENTRLSKMTVPEFIEEKIKKAKINPEMGPSWDEASKILKNARPTKYDVFSSLELYPPAEDLADFIDEFDYKINSGKDLKRVENIHNAVKKIYFDISRIFTEEQLEELRKIN